MPSTVANIVSANLPSIIETIEVRSRFAPPQVFKTRDLVAPGPPSPAVQFTKPMVILRGPVVGEQIIAPAGQVGVNDWKLPVMLVGAAAAVGILVILRLVFAFGKYRGGR